MNRLLFDTTFLVDAERAGDDLDDLIDDEDDVAVAAITVAELRVGVELSSGRRRQARQHFLDDVLAEVPVINYDLGVADAHARLLVAVRKQRRPRGAHDLIIAATAVAAQRTVISSDTTGFADLPDVAVRLRGDR